MFSIRCCLCNFLYSLWIVAVDFFLLSKNSYLILQFFYFCFSIKCIFQYFFYFICYGNHYHSLLSLAEINDHPHFVIIFDYHCCVVWCALVHLSSWLLFAIKRPDAVKYLVSAPNVIEQNRTVPTNWEQQVKLNLIIQTFGSFLCVLCVAVEKSLKHLLIKRTQM